MSCFPNWVSAETRETLFEVVAAASVIIFSVAAITMLILGISALASAAPPFPLPPVGAQVLVGGGCAIVLLIAIAVKFCLNSTLYIFRVGVL